MKNIKTSASLLLMLFLVVLCAACSSGKAPVDTNASIGNLPDSFGTPIEDRNLIAVFDAVIDPENETFTITPSDREAAFHLPLNNYYPNVLQIVGYGWTPNFWADIKLQHPYPGSGIKGFDPRVIAIIPANTGVSFLYNHSLGQAYGNHAVLLNGDGYTNLFDGLASSIVGTVNPFKSYFKAQPYRVWSDTGATSEIQRWQMNLAGFGGPLAFKLVVDVSTNFPAPPVPVNDNAKEPFFIGVNIGTGLDPTGGSAPAEAVLLDWQNDPDMRCEIVAPDLFTGAKALSLIGPGPDTNTYLWGCNISNDNLKMEGDYPVLFVAWDNTTTANRNYIEGIAHVGPSTTTNIYSVDFVAKPSGDTWYDIGVMPQGYVYVCADHPDTGNVGLYRTAIQFTNSLDNMNVLNAQTGMNDPDAWNLFTTIWDKIDVLPNGKLVTNPMQGSVAVWTVSGSVATDDICCFRFICGYDNVAKMADVWNHDDGGGLVPGDIGIGYHDFGQTCLGPDNENQGTVWLMNGTTYAGGGMLSLYWGVGLPFYNIDSIKGVDGVFGTGNAIFLISSATEGKLSLSGDWLSDSYSSGILPTEITSKGSYGPEDGNFLGGLDVTIDVNGNIYTLEDHGGGTYRFQKFDSNLSWKYSSIWNDPGKPMRMDMDKGLNQLFVLCDNGIHACKVN